MAKPFHLTIATIGEHLFDGEVLSVSLPGSEGVFEVFAGHEALVASLAKGEATVTLVDQEKQRFPIAEGGIVEISHNQATVLL